MSNIGLKICELGNFSIHWLLRNLRPAGSKERRIPRATKDPLTCLFNLVSCPNYTYEVGGWLAFTAMTQCLPGNNIFFFAELQMCITVFFSLFSWIVCLGWILPDDRLGFGQTPSLQKGFLRLSSWTQGHHSVCFVELGKSNDTSTRRNLKCSKYPTQFVTHHFRKHQQHLFIIGKNLNSLSRFYFLFKLCYWCCGQHIRQKLWNNVEQTVFNR